MKYMTPELYVRLNALDEAVADAAEAEWEKIGVRYRRHYKRIKEHLPTSVRDFHGTYCLHDAHVIGPAFLEEKTGNETEITFAVQNTDTLDANYLNTMMLLLYRITQPPEITIPVPSSVFQKSPIAVWLYDEIDSVSPGIVCHEILLSDGRVVKLTFSEFRWQVAELVATSAMGPITPTVPAKPARKKRIRA